MLREATMASKFTVSNRTGWLMAGPAVLLIAGVVHVISVQIY